MSRLGDIYKKFMGESFPVYTGIPDFLNLARHRFCETCKSGERAMKLSAKLSPRYFP